MIHRVVGRAMAEPNQKSQEELGHDILMISFVMARVHQKSYWMTTVTSEKLH
jgi:hypothetical protein